MSEGTRVRFNGSAGVTGEMPIPAPSLADVACGPEYPTAMKAVELLMELGEADQLADVAERASVDLVKMQASQDLAVLRANGLGRGAPRVATASPTAPPVQVSAQLRDGATRRSALEDLIGRVAPGPDPWVRSAAARQLAEGEFSGVDLSDDDLKRLYVAMVWSLDWNVTVPLAEVLLPHGEPLAKLGILCDVLKESDWLVRDGLDYRSAARSLSVNHSNESAVGQSLMTMARDWKNDSRMTGLLAALLIGVAGGRGPAGLLVNGIASTQAGFAEPDIRPLRVEIGGATAMRPVLELVNNNFTEPLKRLYEKTQRDWEAATQAAHLGFRIRLGMSAVVFIFGMAITVASAWLVLFADKAEQLLGPGISLAAGLGAMLAVTYRGPLADVRSSVVDLADTDIGFITFMHRLRFTAGLIESTYAQGSLDASAVQKAGDLLETATKDWTRIAHNGAPPTTADMGAAEPEA